MKTEVMALALTAISMAVFGQVVINEIQSSNDATVLDATGETPDWVELRNTSAEETVDISGWGLSDKPKKPFLWTFPSGTTLAPGACLLVFADGRIDLTNELHAASSLSSSGEELLLTAPDGTCVDAVAFGRIPCDTSYGRDTNGDFTYFATPTPGAPNAAETYDAPLDAVQFSVGRGVFDAPFEVALSHADPEADIYYTLDHSNPSSTNGARYASPIAVTGTTIIRATAVKAGALPWRNITTHSYIFPAKVLEQQKPACAGDVWEDNSGGATVQKGKCNASYTVSTNVVHDASTLRQFTEALAAAPIVSVTLDDDQMFNPIYGLHSKPWLATASKPTYTIGKVKYPYLKERAASVEWVTGPNSNRVFGLDAGLKIQGGWGRKFDCTPKKSFQLKFRAKYGASSLDKPVLSDSGCPRDSFESLVLRAEYHDSWAENKAAGIRGNHMKDEFFRELQQPISGYCLYGDYVHLYINGLYWGLYNLCEHADEHTAAEVGGGEAEDYTVVKSKSEVVNGDGPAFKDFATNVWQAVKGYYKDGSSYEDTFVRRGVDMRVPQNYAQAEAFTDMDNYIGYLCLGYYAGNTDWPENNWIAFGIPDAGVPFRWFAWDFETTLSRVDVDVVAVSEMDHNAAFIGNPGHLEKALAFSPAFRQRFGDRFAELTAEDGVLGVASLTNRYAALGAKVRPMLFAEAARWGAYWNEYAISNECRHAVRGLPDWDAEYNRQMNEVIPNRCANVIAQLQACALYPTNALAPTGTLSVDGKALTLASRNADGAVWYTLDGSNPCDPWTGEPGASAVACAGETLSSETNVVVMARTRTADGEWSVLTTVSLKGRAIERNRFLPSTNGENWDKNANWSFGTYPNAPDAYAWIGTPTEVKSGKGWRNVHVNKSSVSVGHVEFENDGWTNRVDTGKYGDFTFYAGEGTNATVEVLDAATAGLAMFDLDDPNRLVLGSTLELIAEDAGGDAQWGAIYLKGALSGNGKGLVKKGAGRVTVGCTNAADAVAVGAVEIAGGELAITKNLSVGSVGGAGCLLVPVLGTNADEAVALSACATGDVTPASVRLFLPFAAEGAYWGGVVAGGALAEANACQVYVLSETGTVWFKNDRYAPPTNAVRVARYRLADGRLTYRVTLGKAAYCPMVDGIQVETTNVLRYATSASPIACETAQVDMSEGVRTLILGGRPVTLPPYYTASVASNPAGGVWVSLALNDRAQPTIADAADGDSKGFSVEGDTISIHLEPNAALAGKTLYYAVESSATLSGEWRLEKDWTPSCDFTFDRPLDAHRFFRIRVSDVRLTGL